jgi:cell division protein FtsL
MPQEVHDWIEQANSLIKYQKTEIAELKLEIKELKAYKAWASKRLTQADYD